MQTCDLRGAQLRSPWSPTSISVEPNFDLQNVRFQGTWVWTISANRAIGVNVPEWGGGICGVSFFLTRRLGRSGKISMSGGKGFDVHLALRWTDQASHLTTRSLIDVPFWLDLLYSYNHCPYPFPRIWQVRLEKRTSCRELGHNLLCKGSSSRATGGTRSPKWALVKPPRPRMIR